MTSQKSKSESVSQRLLRIEKEWEIKDSRSDSKYLFIFFASVAVGYFFVWWAGVGFFIAAAALMGDIDGKRENLAVDVFDEAFPPGTVKRDEALAILGRNKTLSLWQNMLEQGLSHLDLEILLGHRNTGAERGPEREPASEKEYKGWKKKKTPQKPGEPDSKNQNTHIMLDPEDYKKDEE